MSMPLNEWDAKVGYHLHGIEAGAEMCQRHISQMVYAPDFETIAHDDLKTLESFLTTALAKVRKALSDYDQKERHA